MKPRIASKNILNVTSITALLLCSNVNADSARVVSEESVTGETYTYTAGDASLQQWLLPEHPPIPPDNPLTTGKIELGRHLFFDARLSGDGTMSCASCHRPKLGWSDGLPTAHGYQGEVLQRASPALVNVAYNYLLMWDGREKSLEEQAISPMENRKEMNADPEKVIAVLQADTYYQRTFSKVFPGEKISQTTLAKSLAAFERTIISRSSAFDRWVRGDRDAMSQQQVEGFRLFNGKARCAVCHSAPNFTDDGFHNLGLASFEREEPDLGRYHVRRLGVMKGAFKTPTLRDIANSAPYFHDGSAATLKQVIDYYAKGPLVETNVSPNMKRISLTDDEKRALLAFLHALTSPDRSQLAQDLPVKTN